MIRTLMLVAVLGSAAPAGAQVVRLEVTSRESSAGGYEVLRGRVHGEVDPRDRRNTIIQDISLAPVNETSGVPSVLHQAPLGTYLGWNVAASGFFKGQGCGFAGGYWPFAKTQAERAAAGDPRPSVEERYGTIEGYVCAVRRAAEIAVADRFLLRADADRLIREAGASGVLPAGAEGTAGARAIAARVCGTEGAAR